MVRHPNTSATSGTTIGGIPRYNSVPSAAGLQIQNTDSVINVNLTSSLSADGINRHNAAAVKAKTTMNCSDDGVLGNTRQCVLNGPINALSLSPDQSKIVAAGRDVLKIVSIESGAQKLVELQNLRVGKINLNFSSIDVCWHPLEYCRNLLVTAATNGAIVMWDLHKETMQKQEQVITEHARTVNRVTFHPFESYTLLSGSQDGTMKIWDLRVNRSAVHTLHGKAESVRDVQFNTLEPVNFAAAFDNGLVQVWDVRRTDTCQMKLNAHQGPAFSVDWHPEERHMLACAGRDRMIKVWNLGSKPLVTHTVQTIASVSRVKWRPGHRFHISSSALLMDHSVHVWNLEKPFIPHLSFREHRGVVTGIVWRRDGGDSVLSCSKDSSLMLHNASDAYVPRDHVSPVGLTWNVRGDIGYVHTCPFPATGGGSVGSSNGAASPQPTISDAMSSSILPSFMRRPVSTGHIVSNMTNVLNVLSPKLSSSECNADNVINKKLSLQGLNQVGNAPSVVPRPNDIVTSAVSSTSSLTSALEYPGAVRLPINPQGVMERPNSIAADLEEGVDLGAEMRCLSYLAENYVLQGQLPGRLCSLNSAIALGAGRNEIAQSWLILKLMFGLVDVNDNTPSTAPATEVTHTHHDYITSGTSGADSAPIFEPSRSVANGPNVGGGSGHDDGLSALSVSQRSGHAPVLSAMTSRSYADDEVVIDEDHSGAHKDLASIASGIFFEDQMAGLLLSGDDVATGHVKHHEVDAPPLLDWILPDDVTRPLSPISSHSSVASSPSGSRRLSDSNSQSGDDNFSTSAGGSEVPALLETSYQVPAANAVATAAVDGGGSSFGHHRRTRKISRGGTLTSAALQLPTWDTAPLVTDMLMHYGELGDVQTPVSMLIVLGRLFDFDRNMEAKDTQEQWFLSYIELLHRLQLWYVANEVVMLCPIISVKALNQTMTTVYVACSSCSKPLSNGGVTCDRCKASLNPCTLCHRSVHGPYVWCQGCSHGGHLECMRSWFNNYIVCPTGCGHTCQYGTH